MPPKKKNGRGRKATRKRADGGDADCTPVEEMPREQLELFVQRLHQELGRERADRRLFTIERDKINSFWEISLDELRSCRVELRKKNYEIIKTEEKNLTELNTYKKKVKALMCDHTIELADQKANDMFREKLAEDGYVQVNHLISADNKHLQSQLLEQELTFHTRVKNLRMHHRREMSDLRAAFLLEAREMHGRFEKQSEAVRADAARRLGGELAGLEVEKERKVSELIEGHEKSLSDMKNYYSVIVSSNLNSISCLKEELAVARRHEKLTRKQLRSATAQHRELAEPLERLKAEADATKKELACREEERASLLDSNARLVKCEKEIENLKHENDVLHLQLEELQEQRDGLRSGLLLATLEAGQRSGLRAALLRSKLAALADLLRQKDAQAGQVLAASRRRAGAGTPAERRARQLLQAKDSAIEELRNELSRACRACDDLVRACRSKLREHGVSEPDLELAPLAVTATGLLKQRRKHVRRTDMELS